MLSIVDCSRLMAANIGSLFSTSASEKRSGLSVTRGRGPGADCVMEISVSIVGMVLPVSSNIGRGDSPKQTMSTTTLSRQGALADHTRSNFFVNAIVLDPDLEEGTGQFSLELVLPDQQFERLLRSALPPVEA